MSFQANFLEAQLIGMNLIAQLLEFLIQVKPNFTILCNSLINNY